MRFAVDCADPEEPERWERMGSVILRPFAPEWQLEGALAALGVYAPRGADRVRWQAVGQLVACMIYDATGIPLARLLTVTKKGPTPWPT